MSDSLQPDPWLGEVLGCPAFSLREPPGGWRALPAEPPCGLPAPGFVTARLPTLDLAPVHRLAGWGFRLVETNILLEKTPAPRAVPAPPGVVVAPARPEDAGAVARLARAGFRLSRFHLDPMVAREAADEVKARWAVSFFQGLRGDALWVAWVDGEAAGFLLTALGEGQAAVIELIAVDARHRRRGVATALLREAEGRYSGRTRVLVGTQAANIPSLRLYEKEGFRVCQTRYILHYYSKPEDAV